MKMFVLLGLLFMGCDGVVPEDKDPFLHYPELPVVYTPFHHDCERLYEIARAIPPSGWCNQMYVNWMLGEEDPYNPELTKTLKVLHFKYDLLQHIGDENADPREATFYGFASPEDKARLMSTFSRCN